MQKQRRCIRTNLNFVLVQQQQQQQKREQNKQRNKNKRRDGSFFFGGGGGPLVLDNCPSRKKTKKYKSHFWLKS